MSKSKTSLLKDNSWIKKADYEDEPVDDDPNFGRTVLNRYKSNETIVSPEGDDVQTTKTITTSTSVQALSKRFGGSQDEFKSSSLPPSKTTSTKYTYSTVKSDSPITTSKTISTEEQKSSTKTSTVTKNGTTITTTETVSSPVSKTPTKTDIFAERVKSSSKGAQYSSYSPTRTTKVTETTVTSSKDLEDKLYDTLTPTSIRSDFSPVDSKTGISKTETVIVKSSNDTNVEDELYDTLLPTSMKDDFTRSQTSVSSTKTVTVKSSIDGDGVKTTTTTRTSSTSHDPYDTYLPRVTTSSVSSPVSSSSVTKREIVTVESSSRGSDKTYSYTRPDSSYEYTSISSPTAYTSSLYRSSSRSDDILSDPIYSKSSIKSVYAAPERTVLEKDLCTSCRKPFTGDAKIVLGDMKINCHATCFKCEVCNSTLGHLKAGDSMWIYKRMVHCENCFEVTRDKWRR
ncbi:sciellin isoform X3 [Anabas testudineus]|uniref:sciellin isoform X3 n=1 Tax=Anabas testudineus TaxID=64144 RepID=UPI000E460911|nr:sciellin isoform X3 [Anabas testudineus]